MSSVCLLLRMTKLERCERDVVVPWRQGHVIDMADVEGLGDLLFVGTSVVAAAHGSAQRAKQYDMVPFLDEVK
jgi:hypothetical protein